MVKAITVDSSVIVSSLVESESRHKEAMKTWGNVLTGKSFAILPFTVLIEVVSAVRRRTRSERFAMEVHSLLLSNGNILFVDINAKISQEASKLAAKIGVRGMDAVVIQVAKEFDTQLISFDNEMMAKASLVL